MALGEYVCHHRLAGCFVHGIVIGPFAYGIGEEVDALHGLAAIFVLRVDENGIPLFG